MSDSLYEEQLSAAKFRAERDQARQDACVAKVKLGRAIKELGEAKRKAGIHGKVISDQNKRIHDLKREVEKLRCELEKLRRDALRSEIVDQSMDNIEREIKLGVNSIAELLEIGGEIQELPIAEVCPRIVTEMEPRLMPKGCKWPRFDDGEPVRFGDVGLVVHGKRRKCYGVKFTNAGFTFVLDDMGRAWWGNDCWPLEDPEIDPGKRVKRPSVPAGDGVHIKAGDTIYSDDYKEGLIVDGYQHNGSLIAHMRDGNHVVIRDSRHFTHTRPEPPDTWGLIWTSVTTGTTTLHEFERRCKELARKENNNE